MPRPRLKLVPLGDPEHFKSLLFSDEPLTLRELLEQSPALSKTEIQESWMQQQLEDLSIIPVSEPLSSPLFRPPGMKVGPSLSKTNEVSETTSEAGKQTTEVGKQTTKADEQTIETVGAEENPAGHPARITEKEAVTMAYAREIEKTASFLRTGLSVLVMCDKLIVEHLGREMVGRAQKTPQMLTTPVEEDGGFMSRGLRQRQLAALKTMIKSLKHDDVLIIPHLDLLAGGDANPHTEARELIELVYESSDRLILAFADRSLEIPEVLASRFAVRLSITGLHQTVICLDDTEKIVGEALVTQAEAARFAGFKPEELYKNVSGMNPIRLRHALQYAVEENASEERISVNKLIDAIRSFKAQTSANFEAPNVSFKQIGGYDDVKAELTRAIRLMGNAFQLSNEKLRQELIPKGFIFYGPPGTGKTLFAKAIANQLNATIQVVSGPEVTDKYVGESERKVRELFAEARRNAPSILVFDEFDSIASKRSGRDDGGSRAGNALVAQILTEMDGFRPDVPMLVIGTTNRLDIIDDALLRPSRFKAIAIKLPDQGARQAIARVHAQHFDIEATEELLEVIASATEGMNGDDIRSLFRDAYVGLYCEEPPIDVNAQRFGQLVGLLRQAKQRQQSSQNEQQDSLLLVTPRGERPRPRGPMIDLTPSASPTEDA